MPEDFEISDLESALSQSLGEAGVDESSVSDLADATPQEPPTTEQVVTGIGETAPASVQTPPPQPPPPTEAAAPPDPEGANTPLMDNVKAQYGQDFASKYNTDEDFIQGMLHLNTMAGQQARELQQFRQIQADPEAWARQILPEPPAPQYQTYEPQTPPPQQPPPDPSQPGFDHNWLKHVQLREDAPQSVREGLVRYAQEEPIRRQMSPYIEKINDLEQRLEQQAQQVAQQPQDQVPAEQAIEARFAQHQDDEFAKDYIVANKDRLFVGGDINSGQMTPMGHEFMGHLAYAEQRWGARTARDQVEWAEAMIGNSMRQAQAPPPNGQHAVHSPGLAAPPPSQEFDDPKEGESIEAYTLRMLAGANVPVQ